MQLLEILDRIYLSVILLGGLAGLVRFKRLTPPARIITIILLVSLLSESIATWLTWKQNDNTPVYHFYVIVSFWLYSLCYYKLLKTNKLRISLLLIPVIFTLFAIIDSVGFQTLHQFPSINIIVSSALISLYSLFYFKYLIDLNPFESLRRNSRFLLNTSILIYFTLEVFEWGIIDYMMHKRQSPYLLFCFGFFVSIGYYLALGLSIIFDKKPSADKK